MPDAFSGNIRFRRAELWRYRMNGMNAFMKKEFMEWQRTGRMVILGSIFVLFGVMAPAFAKLTPWLMGMMAQQLAETGLTVTQVPVDALTSWGQFFKNLPLALVAYTLLCSGIFIDEYRRGTLIPVVTRGLPQRRAAMAKFCVMAFMWTVGYFICFGITYVYTAAYWKASVTANLVTAALCAWLFGILVTSLITIFSALSDSSSGVLLGTGGSVAVMYFLSILPRVTKYIPTRLLNGSSLLTGESSPHGFFPAVAVSLALAAACTALSALLFNRRQM